MKSHERRAGEWEDAACETCGVMMVRTSALYWACPFGHGKLHLAENIRDSEVAKERKLLKERLDAAFPKKLSGK